MSYVGVLEDIKKCAQGEKPQRVPLFPFVNEFNMRNGGMTYREIRTDIEKVVRMNCQAVEKFDYDWAVIFPDDYVEWEPFGLEIQDEENLPAIPNRYLAATSETVKNMVLPNPTRDGRMPIHIEMIRQVKKALGNATCVAGRIATPFSSIGLLFGVETLMLKLCEDSAFIKDAMEKIMPFIIQWGKCQRDAGADVLWVGDCLSSSSFISPETLAEVSLPYTEHVLEVLKKTGLFLIYHASEKSVPHITLSASLSADAINVNEAVKIWQLKEQLKCQKCLMGNLDPLMVLRNGTSKEVGDATISMLQKNKERGGYIFCTSEGVTQDTPEENIIVMMEAAKKGAIYL